MSRFSDIRETGRVTRGPSYDLAEAYDAQGRRHLALVFGEDFRDAKELTASVDPVMGFLEMPMVGGVAPLADRASGRFLYAVGDAWPIRDVLRAYIEIDDICGPRAGLELAIQAATVLQEAAEIGAAQDVHSHGNLSPWTLLVDAKGNTLVIGYGIPPVAIFDYLDDAQLLPPADDARYAPPERLEGLVEDVGSDLFALALIVAEVISGYAPYEGSLNEFLDDAHDGVAATLLDKSIPAPIRDWLATALAPLPADRHPSPQAFTDAARDLLADADGPSLTEVLARAAEALPSAFAPSEQPVWEDTPPADDKLDALALQAADAAEAAAIAADRADELVEQADPFQDTAPDELWIPFEDAVLATRKAAEDAAAAADVAETTTDLAEAEQQATAANAAADLAKSSAAIAEQAFQRMVEEQGEQERLAREEQERIEREEQERLAREEQERFEREEQERLEREEQERIAREEQERLEREEQERIEREEQERLAREEQERIEREEQERLAREEQERIEQEEQERLAREEQERIEREEQERLAREEQERIAREEQERIAREEQERIAREEQERIAREEQERMEALRSRASGLVDELPPLEERARELVSEAQGAMAQSEAPACRVAHDGLVAAAEQLSTLAGVLRGRVDEVMGASSSGAAEAPAEEAERDLAAARSAVERVEHSFEMLQAALVVEAEERRAREEEEQARLAEREREERAAAATRLEEACFEATSQSEAALQACETARSCLAELGQEREELLSMEETLRAGLAELQQLDAQRMAADGELTDLAQRVDASVEQIQRVGAQAQEHLDAARAFEDEGRALLRQRQREEAERAERVRGAADAVAELREAAQRHHQALVAALNEARHSGAPLGDDACDDAQALRAQATAVISQAQGLYDELQGDLPEELEALEALQEKTQAAVDALLDLTLEPVIEEARALNEQAARDAAALEQGLADFSTRLDQLSAGFPELAATRERIQAAAVGLPEESSAPSMAVLEQLEALREGLGEMAPPAHLAELPAHLARLEERQEQQRALIAQLQTEEARLADARRAHDDEREATARERLSQARSAASASQEQVAEVRTAVQAVLDGGLAIADEDTQRLCAQLTEALEALDAIATSLPAIPDTSSPDEAADALEKVLKTQTQLEPAIASVREVASQLQEAANAALERQKAEERAQKAAAKRVEAIVSEAHALLQSASAKATGTQDALGQHEHPAVIEAVAAVQDAIATIDARHRQLVSESAELSADIVQRLPAVESLLESVREAQQELARLVQVANSAARDAASTAERYQKLCEALAELSPRAQSHLEATQTAADQATQEAEGCEGEPVANALGMLRDLAAQALQASESLRALVEHELTADENDTLAARLEQAQGVVAELEQQSVLAHRQGATIAELAAEEREQRALQAERERQEALAALEAARARTGAALAHLAEKLDLSRQHLEVADSFTQRLPSSTTSLAEAQAEHQRLSAQHGEGISLLPSCDDLDAVDALHARITSSSEAAEALLQTSETLATQLERAFEVHQTRTAALESARAEADAHLEQADKALGTYLSQAEALTGELTELPEALDALQKATASIHAQVDSVREGLSQIHAATEVEALEAPQTAVRAALEVLASAPEQALEAAKVALRAHQDALAEAERQAQARAALEAQRQELQQQHQSLIEQVAVALTLASEAPDAVRDEASAELLSLQGRAHSLTEELAQADDLENVAATLTELTTALPAAQERSRACAEAGREQLAQELSARRAELLDRGQAARKAMSEAIAVCTERAEAAAEAATELPLLETIASAIRERAAQARTLFDSAPALGDESQDLDELHSVVSALEHRSLELGEFVLGGQVDVEQLTQQQLHERKALDEARSAAQHAVENAGAALSSALTHESRAAEALDTHQAEDEATRAHLPAIQDAVAVARGALEQAQEAAAQAQEASRSATAAEHAEQAEQAAGRATQAAVRAEHEATLLARAAEAEANQRAQRAAEALAQALRDAARASASAADEARSLLSGADEAWYQAQGELGDGPAEVVALRDAAATTFAELKAEVERATRSADEARLASQLETAMELQAQVEASGATCVELSQRLHEQIEQAVRASRAASTAAEQLDRAKDEAKQRITAGEEALQRAEQAETVALTATDSVSDDKSIAARVATIEAAEATRTALAALRPLIDAVLDASTPEEAETSLVEVRQLSQQLDASSRQAKRSATEAIEAARAEAEEAKRREEEAIEAARASAREAADQAHNAARTCAELLAEAQTTIEGYDHPDAQRALSRLRELAAETSLAAFEAGNARDIAVEATSSPRAHDGAHQGVACAERATKAAAQAPALLEQLTKATRAQQEARDAESRALIFAIAAAKTAADEAQSATAGARQAIEDAKDELQATPIDKADELRTAAERHVAEAERHAAAGELFARQTAEQTASEPATKRANMARVARKKAIDSATAANEAIQQALALCRAAASEAEALERMRTEAEALSRRVYAAAERAQQHVARARQVTADTTDKAALQARTDAVAAASTAAQEAGKAGLAAKAIAEALTPADAEAHLNTAREALERASQASDLAAEKTEEASREAALATERARIAEEERRRREEEERRRREEEEQRRREEEEQRRREEEERRRREEEERRRREEEERLRQEEADRVTMAEARERAQAKVDEAQLIAEAIAAAIEQSVEASAPYGDDANVSLGVQRVLQAGVRVASAAETTRAAAPTADSTDVRAVVAAADATEAGALRTLKAGRSVEERIALLQTAITQAAEREAREAQERAEREAREKAEREAKEKAEQEAREKAEREAKEKAEREAKEKAEREAREKAEREAREKAEQEAREKAEREAKEKAEREAKEKAEREAKEKAEQEAREKAEQEAKEKAEQAAAERAARMEALRQATPARPIDGPRPSLRDRLAAPRTPAPEGGEGASLRDRLRRPAAEGGESREERLAALRGRLRTVREPTSSGSASAADSSAATPTAAPTATPAATPAATPSATPAGAERRLRAPAEGGPRRELRRPRTAEGQDAAPRELRRPRRLDDGTDAPRELRRPRRLDDGSDAPRELRRPRRLDDGGDSADAPRELRRPRQVDGDDLRARLRQPRGASDGGDDLRARLRRPRTVEPDAEAPARPARPAADAGDLRARLRRPSAPTEGAAPAPDQNVRASLAERLQRRRDAGLPAPPAPAPPADAQDGRSERLIDRLKRRREEE